MSSLNHSLVLLSVVLSSKSKAANYIEIADAMDYINHEAPEIEEVKYSLNWLIKKNFIIKIADEYILSEKGKAAYDEASAKNKLLLKIWNDLEQKIV